MKVKIQVIVTREIEINREYYPANYSEEEILQYEINYADELFHDWSSSDNVTFETKGEIIPEITL